MALLQFMTTGIPRVRVPSSVHTDHLITARDGATADLERAIKENKEVYDFLESCCAKVSDIHCEDNTKRRLLIYSVWTRLLASWSWDPASSYL